MCVSGQSVFKRGRRGWQCPTGWWLLLFSHLAVHICTNAPAAEPPMTGHCQTQVSTPREASVPRRWLQDLLLQPPTPAIRADIWDITDHLASAPCWFRFRLMQVYDLGWFGVGYGGF